MKKSRAIALSIIFLMIFATFCSVADCNAYAAKSGGVRIGQATNGEGGSLRGNKAGDQSGGEVSLSNWSYSKGSSSAFHWKYVFRAKDPSVAKQLAANMKAAAANNHIGYDQQSPDRNSFYDEAKKVGWDISAIRTNCETTCGSAISVCINAAGITVPRTWYSEIIPKDIMKTGAFDCYTSSDYTASPAKLLPGDILCNPDRHTAMVVESPNPFRFDVSYVDCETSEEETVSIIEGTEIQLNLNNGEGTEIVTVNDKVDLADFEPEKGSFKFVGWRQIDDESFAAAFAGASVIKTDNERKKILD